MTHDELQAIKARAEAATPNGRITYSRYEHGGGRAFVDGEAGDRHLVMDSYSKDDREFDFATRTDVPALVAEVERLRVLIAETVPVFETLAAVAESEYGNGDGSSERDMALLEKLKAV